MNFRESIVYLFWRIGRHESHLSPSLLQDRNQDELQHCRPNKIELDKCGALHPGYSCFPEKFQGGGEKFQSIMGEMYKGTNFSFKRYSRGSHEQFSFAIIA